MHALSIHKAIALVTASFALSVVVALTGSACAGGDDGCFETCEEVYPSFDDDVHALLDGRVACTEHAECEAVIPSTGCDQKATWLSLCHVAVRGDEAQAFLDDVAALADVYCQECMPECHMPSDCPSTFAPACREGVCEIAIVNPE